jgi:lipopolysaccharide transport system ATP-binding protein
MSEFAIKAVGLGKRFRIGSRVTYKSLRETLANTIHLPVRKVLEIAKGQSTGRRDSQESTFWALRNLDLKIKEGEVVGIIGRNGAGKSTLLKILAQITAPTEGYAEMNGRVGSLLEVGVGFHPELTGRENIYLNGALLGMHKFEIERNFDQIVAFAEIDQFLDTAVKHYSSGMYVRLGFAVAAHLETEILFVDEVLSVGDVAFQEKCIGKMKDVAGSGRTVLFVSHNLLSIQALCNRAVLLDKGVLTAEGNPSSVVSRYMESVRQLSNQVRFDRPEVAPGNEFLRLRSASIRVADGCREERFTVRSPLRFEFEVWNAKPGANLDFAFNLFNQYGVLVMNSGTVDSRVYSAGLIRMSCEIPGDLLNSGLHSIEFLTATSSVQIEFSIPDLLTFEISDSLDLRGVYHGEWPGAVRPNIAWTTTMDN